MNINMQHPRKLETGEFSIIRGVLPETIIDRLRATANQLKDIDSSQFTSPTRCLLEKIRLKDTQMQG